MTAIFCMIYASLLCTVNFILKVEIRNSTLYTNIRIRIFTKQYGYAVSDVLYRLVNCTYNVIPTKRYKRDNG